MSEKVAYYGAATAILSSLTLNDIGVLVGIIVGVVTCGYNIWYKNKLLKIAQQKGVNIVEDVSK